MTKKYSHKSNKTHRKTYKGGKKPKYRGGRDLSINGKTKKKIRRSTSCRMNGKCSAIV